MEKIINPGIIDTGNGRRANFFCKVEIKNGRLSISGVIGPLRSGNALGGCGQIDMEFEHRNPDDNDSRYSCHIKADEIKFSYGWNKEIWLKFLDVWKDWHLNDMNAGTQKQEKAIKEWRRKNKISGLAYDEECKYLKSIRLYTDNGHKYGSSWLLRTLPQDVIDFLESLPETIK